MKDANKDNFALWNRHADVDPKFTKPISGKDYGGTSPNPQYVIRCLTEMFGPVGKGFGWSVLAEAFEPLGDTHLHWCRIRFWWRDEQGEHSVEEYGQTKAAYVTSKGSHRVDEDAPKKSLTDAIIKGASHLGVAANIFLGRWDDQKYVAQVNAEYRDEERKEKAAPAPKADDSAVQEAVDCFGKADTLDAANAIWRDLPADVKANPRVIDAAKAAKARNKPQVAA